MKYFTPQLWLGINSSRSKMGSSKDWGRAFEAYEQQLKPLLPKLSANAQKFFKEVSLHDGTVTRIELGDQIDAPVHQLQRKNLNRRKAAIRLFVLSGEGEQVYVLDYRRVTRVEMNFPGKIELFPSGENPNFGDWGYDELTMTNREQLRHEILFSSGATILVEFEEFSFRRKPAELKRSGPRSARTAQSNS